MLGQATIGLINCTVDSRSGSPVPREPMPRGTLIKRQGANLPHWRVDGAIYATTFRLADSLPASVLEGWRRERLEIERNAEAQGRPLTPYEASRLEVLHGQRVEEWLDRGHGNCAMKDPRIAKLVADAVRHFDGERYNLFAWCVMPNHVHAVLQTYPGHDLSMILLSWKGFTGKKAREILNTRGQGEFWQKEPYDHVVRDAGDLAHQINYVLQNPVRAGLKDWPWVGRGLTGQKPGATWHRPSGR